MPRSFVETPLSNAASTTDQTIITRVENYEQIRFHITMLATGSPAGTINFSGSIAGDRYCPLNITDSSYIGGLNADITWSASTPHVITLAAPATIAISVGFWRPPPLVKVFWDVSSGGDATGFYIDSHKWGVR